MTHRFSVLAWGGFCLALAFGAGTIFLTLATATGQTPWPELLGDFFYSASGVITAAVGALVAARRSRNPLGWIMVAIGLALTLQQLAYDYTSLGFSSTTQPSPIHILALWISQWLWPFPYVGLVLLLLLFPAGRLLSPRWRWVAGLSLFLYGALTVLWAVSTPMTLSTRHGETISIANPIGLVRLGQEHESVVLPFIIAVLAFTLISALLALWLRYRRAHAVERKQLKWFFYAAIVFVFTFIPTSIFNNQLFGVLIDVVALGLPVSIGIAILRYRLWEIDVIIRRTLVYSTLSGLLALTYFALITLLQSLFSAISNQQSEISIVLSTLAIAALFFPLRNRVQDFIDRRFYRQKYDAQKVLADFAATCRDETDLEQLTARLAEVVDEAMHPESVRLWLKPTRAKRRETDV
ncbi:MAG: hypothetical protein ACT4QE_19105 [Anaerolineales bacterium]